jgi:hypothetical protein
VTEGRIVDHIFIDVGFGADKTSDGTETFRLAEISQENQQRAKSLAHATQRQARAILLQTAKEKEDDKHKKVADDMTLLLQKNQECVRVLFQHFSEEKLLSHEIQAATDHPSFLDGGDWIGDVEHKHFHKLTAPLLKELKAFIHSRTFATVRPPQDSGIRWKRGQNSAHNGMGV